MSALGGIIHASQAVIDPEQIFRMSRSMMLRGTEQRGAYFHRGVGVFYNGRLTADPPSRRQPLTLTRDGKNYTVVLDGQITGVGELSGAPSPHDFLSSAELILESYLSFGAECIGSFDGSFSLVICDEARGEVLLARDRRGSHPLFFATDGEILAFASEIKALLRFVPDASIHTERLREHVVAPCGVYDGESLYRGISSIPAGHCGIFSRLGMHLFPYEEITCGERRDDATAGKLRVTVSFFCPDRDTLRQHLTETLFAFDYPQFDHWTSGFLRALEEIPAEKRSRSIVVEDATPCVSLGYARERADRLGALRAVSIDAVLPMECSVRPRELKRMDRLLGELLEEADADALCRLFGENWMDAVTGEKNLEKRIRMQGLFYQTALWMKHYPLRFV